MSWYSSSTVATNLKTLIAKSTTDIKHTVVDKYSVGNSTKTQSKDNISCPDQSHWIFIGIICGLAIGLFLLWLFNCFHVKTTVTQSRSDEN